MLLVTESTAATRKPATSVSTPNLHPTFNRPLPMFITDLTETHRQLTKLTLASLQAQEEIPTLELLESLDPLTELD